MGRGGFVLVRDCEKEVRGPLPCQARNCTRTRHDAKCGACTQLAFISCAKDRVLDSDDSPWQWFRGRYGAAIQKQGFVQLVRDPCSQKCWANLEGKGGVDIFLLHREKVALLNRMRDESRIRVHRSKAKANTSYRFFDFEYEAMRFPGFCLTTTTPFTCQVILRAQNFARSRDCASRVHG